LDNRAEVERESVDCGEVVEVDVVIEVDVGVVEEGLVLSGTEEREDNAKGFTKVEEEEEEEEDEVEVEEEEEEEEEEDEEEEEEDETDWVVDLLLLFSF
jgi:hypothetical protein